MGKKAGAFSERRDNMISLEFFFVLALLYGVGAVSARRYMTTLSLTTLRLMRWSWGLAVVLHLSFLISMLYLQRHFLPTQASESPVLLTAVLGIVGFVLSFRRSWLVLVLVLYPFIVGILLGFRMISPAELQAPLPTPWLWIHILLMLAGEAFFLLSAAVAVVYLAADYQFRARQPSGLFARIPSLAVVDRLSSEILWTGFILLSVGMPIGFLFAKQYWPVGWWLDPKVVMCVLTWIVYAGILGARLVSANFRGKRSATMACVGFLIVVFLAWGVEHFFPSQHAMMKGWINLL